jgi:hypothetical protein
MGHNTCVHKSNARNISIAILNSTSKNALSSSLCLCLLFNKISDKGKQDLPGTEGVRGREGGGAGWRNDPNNVCRCE